MADIEVRVPDLGAFENVPVIEVHVHPGDTVSVEDPLITLESDKATLDVPAPVGGTVGSLIVAVGDHVSEGSAIAIIAASGDAGAPPRERIHESGHLDTGEKAGYGSASGVYDRIEVTVPDIGDFDAVLEQHMRLPRSRCAECGGRPQTKS